MFKLNRMTDYATVVLGVLAHRQGEILATAQLAELTGLNQPTVAKVAKTLVVADLLETQRGVHGGYRLARPAAMISRTLSRLVSAAAALRRSGDGSAVSSSRDGAHRGGGAESLDASMARVSAS